MPCPTHINPTTEPAFTYQHPDMATIFTALHLFFRYLTTRLRDLMPTLTDLLNRPLYPGELAYIGYIVEEPIQIDAESFSDAEEEELDQDAAPADGLAPLNNPDDPPPPPPAVSAVSTTEAPK